MNSHREPGFQQDPVWPMRTGGTVSTARNFGTPGLESDARTAGFRHSLPDRRLPGRATDLAFGNLPPWAQPAWIQQFPKSSSIHS